MEHVVMKDRTAALSATPAQFTCADCEKIELSLDRQLPQGWDKVEHRGRTVVRCNECLEVIEREHRPTSAMFSPEAIVTVPISAITHRIFTPDLIFSGGGREVLRITSDGALIIADAEGAALALLDAWSALLGRKHSSAAPK